MYCVSFVGGCVESKDIFAECRCKEGTGCVFEYHVS